MTTAPAPSTRLINGGQLVLTQGVSTYVEQGTMPYCDDVEAGTAPRKWRRHFLAVAVTSHLSGCWGQTDKDDCKLNDYVFNHPGEGGRLLSVWQQDNFPKLWVITDGYGSDHAVTTALFPEEY